MADKNRPAHRATEPRKGVPRILLGPSRPGTPRETDRPHHAGGPTAFPVGDADMEAAWNAFKISRSKSLAKANVASQPMEVCSEHVATTTQTATNDSAVTDGAAAQQPPTTAVEQVCVPTTKAEVSSERPNGSAPVISSNEIGIGPMPDLEERKMPVVSASTPMEVCSEHVVDDETPAEKAARLATEATLKARAQHLNMHYQSHAWDHVCAGHDATSKAYHADVNGKKRKPTGNMSPRYTSLDNRSFIARMHASERPVKTPTVNSGGAATVPGETPHAQGFSDRITEPNRGIELPAVTVSQILLDDGAVGTDDTASVSTLAGWAPVIVPGNNNTRLETTEREPVKFTYRYFPRDRNTRVYLSAKGHPDHLLGIVTGEPTAKAAGLLKHKLTTNLTLHATSQRSGHQGHDMPDWAHEPTCQERKGQCCFHKLVPVITSADDLSYPLEAMDDEVGEIHALHQSYRVTSEGTLVYAKTRLAVPRAEAQTVLSLADVQARMNIAKQIRERAATEALVALQEPSVPSLERADGMDVIAETQPPPAAAIDDSKSDSGAVHPPVPATVEQMLTARNTVTSAVECAICRGRFVEPIQLHCGHTFCAGCINGWFRTQHSCPNCRSEQPEFVVRAAFHAAGSPRSPSAASSVSSSSAGPVIPAPVGGERLLFWTSAETRERARRNGYVYIPGEMDTPHPMHSIAKRVMLNYINAHIPAAILMGGKVQLSLNMRHTYQHMNGLARPNDIISNAAHRNFACNCTVLTCPHLDGKIPVSVMRPEITVDLMALAASRAGTNTFYIADAEIQGARGSVCRPDMEAADLKEQMRVQTIEAHYAVDAVGTVHYSMHQDAHGFVYPMPHYQYTNQINIGDSAYSVRRIFGHDGFTLFMFRLIGRAAVAPAAPPELAPAIRRVDYIGPVAWSPDSDAKSPANELVEMGIRNAYSFNTDLILGSAVDLGTYVPKTLLCSAAMSVAHMPRNQSTYQGLRINVLDLVKPLHNTPDDKLKMVTAVIPLAMTFALNDEVNHMQAHVAPMHSSMERLNGLLDFTRPTLGALVLGPFSDAQKAGIRRQAAKVGLSIQNNPWRAAALAAILSLTFATALGWVMGPGEAEPPATIMTQIEGIKGWFKDAAGELVVRGTDAYARTFPKCSGWYTRRLGLEPRCYIEDNGHAELIDTWRYAFYARMVNRLLGTWTFFGKMAFEEVVKRLHSGGVAYGLYAVVGFEALDKLWRAGIVAFMPILVVSAMHVYTYTCDFYKSLFLHIMWNFSVFAMAIDPVFYGQSDLPLAMIIAYAWCQRAWACGERSSVGATFGPGYVARESDCPIDDTAQISRARNPKRATGIAFKQMGPLVADYLPNVPSVCSENLYRAVRSRHLLPKRPLGLPLRTIQVAIAAVTAMMRWPTAVRQGHSHKTRLGVISFDEWLQHYTPSQRLQLVNGRERVQRCGFRPIWARAHRVFAKREKLLKQGADFAPRLVLTVTPMFSSVVGPYLFSLSKWMLKNWNKDSAIMYASGATLEAISDWAQWHHDHGYILFKGDQSKCDSSYWKSVLQACGKVYTKYCLCLNSVYRAIAAAYTKCRIFGNDGLRASVEGTLVTGSNETTIGNTKNILFCQYASLWLFLRGLGARGRPLLAQLRVCFNEPGRNSLNRPMAVMQAGDDNIIAVRADIVALGYNPESIGDFGFRPTYRAAPLPHLDFLSSVFWPINGKWKLGAKPGRQLAKLGADIDGCDNPTQKVRGVALGMVRQVNHVPVLGAAVRRILQLTRGVKAQPHYEQHKSTAEGMDSPADDTYAFAAARYGLDAVDILQAERNISQWTLAELIDCPVVRRMVQVDVE